MQITGSEAVIKSLLEENVEIIFGYPGGAIMPIYDALFHYADQIKHVLVRHEQGAAHAAEGYARITGKPGVCFATSGPGATNLVTGIADAMIDSVPLFCITGQVDSKLLGTDAFQEVDVIGITSPITKWNYQITNAKEIADVIQKAFHIAAAGRPGPVVIDITKDAQFEKVAYSYPKKKIAAIKNNVSLSKIQKAAMMINHAKKPLILSGHGVLIAKATKELQQFAEKSDIPVACTLHGLSTFPVDNPLYAGMLGMHGNYAPNVLTNQADVIIAIGMRFDDRVTGRTKDYATQAKIIHIDIDASEFNKNIPVDIAIHADAKEALTMLIPKMKQMKHDLWISEFKKLYQKEHAAVIYHDVTPNHTQKIKMAEVIHLLARKTKGNAIIVADVGQHQMTAARYYQHTYPNYFITSGGAGTMGFALPAAIGAKIGAPETEVIAVIGDGSFQMTLQELGTIMQEKLPVKIVILNNHFLGMVRQWQQMFFEKRYSFTNMQNPDFVNIAKAYGIEGEKVEKRKTLETALDILLQSRNSFLLDIEVEKEANVFPMIPTGAAVHEMRLK